MFKFVKYYYEYLTNYFKECLKKLLLRIFNKLLLRILDKLLLIIINIHNLRKNAWIWNSFLLIKSE